MRYLVTGGTGFIGAYVSRQLVDAGHHVTVLDLAPNHQFLTDILGGSLADGVEIVSGDVTDLPQLLRTMRASGTERVIHLAAALTRSMETNPLRGIKVNVEGTVNVFEAAQALGVTKVVWASSVAVFGSGGREDVEPVANDALRTPTGLYGAAKSMNEILGAHYQRHFGLDNVGLRFTSVYGYGDNAFGRGLNLRVELLEKPVRGQPGVIRNGKDIVDFLYVEDAARAVVLASEAPTCSSSGLNVCGDRRSMAEAVAYVRQLLPSAQLRVVTDGPAHNQILDSSVTEAMIGYRAQFGMEDGFRSFINVWRAKQGLAAVQTTDPRDPA